MVSWNDGAQRIKGYESSEIIGQHFSRFYPPDDIAGGKPARGLEAAAVQGRFEDLGWRVRKDGSRFWANVVITALRDEAGSLRSFLKITRDMTERRLVEEIRDALIHVTEGILEGQDAESVLRLIVQHARELVGADGATGIVPDLSGGTLVFRVAEGVGADALQGTRISMTQSISGEVMRTGRPLKIPDVSKDPRVAPQVAQVADFGPALFMPLIVRGRAIGTIVIFRLRGRPGFTDEHLRVAELFAAQAAVAMDHARTAEARQRAVDRLPECSWPQTEAPAKHTQYRASLRDHLGSGRLHAEGDGWGGRIRTYGGGSKGRRSTFVEGRGGSFHIRISHPSSAGGRRNSRKSVRVAGRVGGWRGANGRPASVPRRLPVGA